MNNVFQISVRADRLRPGDTIGFPYIMRTVGRIRTRTDCDLIFVHFTDGEVLDWPAHIAVPLHFDPREET